MARAAGPGHWIEAMIAPSRYCAGPKCRRTTKRLRVRVRGRTYLYCVECGRRLELRRPRAG